MDNKSTFMVFDRETFGGDVGNHVEARWATDNYGKIMEFKPGCSHAHIGMYRFDRDWCRPLTMQDFIEKKIAVTFDTADEQKRFLQECERAGLTWPNFDKATKYEPSSPQVEFNYYGKSSSPFGRENHLTHSSLNSHTDEGWITVPFSSFAFEAPTVTQPRREIHITSDGLTTHAVYKQDGKIVKRSKAVCNPSDKYDFEVGAWLAMNRLCDKNYPPKPVTPAYREVKRHAKPGEKIKIVAAKFTGNQYKNGDIMTCDWNSLSYVVSVSEFAFPCVGDDEYVVLEPIDPAEVRPCKKN